MTKKLQQKKKKGKKSHKNSIRTGQVPEDVVSVNCANEVPETKPQPISDVNIPKAIVIPSQAEGKENDVPSNDPSSEPLGEVLNGHSSNVESSPPKIKDNGVKISPNSPVLEEVENDLKASESLTSPLDFEFAKPHNIVKSTAIPIPRPKFTNNCIQKNSPTKALRVYDREFLMQLSTAKICLIKPACLNNFNQISREAGSADPRKSLDARKSVDQRRNSHSFHRNSSVGKKIIPIINAFEKLDLKTTENPWKPKFAINGEQVEEDEKTIREAKSILNKMTPQNFKKLTEKLLAFDLNHYTLTTLIDIVFMKAVSEPKYSEMYAKMCCALAKLNLGKSSQTDFRRLIITKCQHVYETSIKKKEDKTDEDEEVAVAKEDEEDAVAKEEDPVAKNRNAKMLLGLIEFIGQLFNQNMLTYNIIISCIDELLRQKSNSSIESFRILIYTAGLKMYQMPEKCEKPLNKIYTEVNLLIESKQFNFRTESFLKDTLELKEKNFESTRVCDPTKDKPKTLATIHKEAAKDPLYSNTGTPKLSLNNNAGQRQSFNPNNSYSNNNSYRQNNPNNSYNNNSYRQNNPNSSYINNQRQNNPNNRQSNNYNNQFDNRNSFYNSKDNNSFYCGQQQEDNPYLATSSTNRFSYSNKNSTGKDFLNNRKSVPNLNPLSSSNNHKAGQFSQWSQGCKSRKSQGSTQDKNGAASKAPEMKMLNKYALLNEDSLDANNVADEVASSNKPSNRMSSPPPRASSYRPSLTSVKEAPTTGNVLTGKDSKEFDIKKANAIFNSYYNTLEMDEAIENLCKLAHSNNISQILYEAANTSLDKLSRHRQLLGNLFVKLLQRRIVTKNHFKESFTPIIESYEDIVIDVPNVATFIAEILSPVFLYQDLELLKNLLQPFKQSQIPQKILIQLFKVSSKVEDLDKIIKTFSRQLSLADLIENPIDIDDFIKKHVRL